MTDIMTDLETMGTSSSAPILAIGAVRFDKEGLHETFYKVISLESNMSLGRAPDAATIMWWMQQSDEARKALYRTSALDLASALREFTNYVASFGNTDNVKLWGNGAAFDNVILADAYRTCNLFAPWRFWNDRCYRTMKSLCPEIPIKHTGVAHNALDDAKSQAQHLIEIFKGANYYE